MGVVWTPESEHAKEMRRWEAHHTQYGPPGRPHEYRPYPAAMYKAERLADGTRRILPMQTAKDEQEQRNFESRGYVAGGPQAALDECDRIHIREAGKLAAEREFSKRRMSAKARAEADAAEAAHGARHLPDVPETPIKRRGRKPKIETPEPAPVA